MNSLMTGKKKQGESNNYAFAKQRAQNSEPTIQ